MRISTALAMLLAAAYGGMAWGQTPIAPRERVPDAPKPLGRLDLPPRNGATTLPAVRRGPQIMLRTIRFEGATALDESELQALAAPYLGRALTGADLEALRREVSRAYIARGYLNSGALLPDQTLGDGVLVVRVVEGRLSEVRLMTDRRLRRPALARRAFRALPKETPFQASSLERAFRRALNEPLIDRMDGRLRPGARTGEALLDLTADLVDPLALEMGFDNHRPPGSGEFAGFLNAALRNAAGFGETFEARLVGRGGALDGFGGASVPLHALGPTLFIEGRRAESDLVEAPLDELDIESTFWAVTVGLRQTVWRGVRWQADLGVRGAYAEGRTEVGGVGFDFAEGVSAEGESATATVKLEQNLRYRGDRIGAALRSTVTLGLDAFDATVNAFGADGRFAAWLVQAQTAWRPFHMKALEDVTLIARGDAQFTTSRLLPIERYTVGGAFSVRGYRQNTLVRDIGWSASLEARRPFARFGVPGLVSKAKAGPLEASAFIDLGAAWNVDAPGIGRDALGSVGVALAWRPTPWLSADVAYAYAFKPSPAELNAVQDRGVHLRLALDPIAAARHWSSNRGGAGARR